MYLKVLILTVYLLNVHGSKILGIFHMPSHSHFTIGKVLFKGLAKQGHEVTMVSPFPLKSPVKNYEDIFLEEILEMKDGPLVTSMTNSQNKSISEQMAVFKNFSITMLELCLNNKGLQSLLKSNRKFDLVVIDLMLSESLLGIADHYNTAVVAVNVAISSFMTDKITGNSHPYSYVPNGFIVGTDKMTFIQRLTNTLSSMLMEVSDKYVNDPLQRKVLSKFFPNAPPLEELRKNVSLMLVNSHPVVESPRPYTPNMIQIAGMHIGKPKELSKELMEFLNNAKEGFIYFSLGSTLKSADLPVAKLNQIINAFRRIKLKVLWKFESEYIADLPRNLKISKWFSQTDILAHPNIKAFVTHGGILSTMESIHFSVPMVGIPCFGDQFMNIQRSVENGYAVSIKMDDMIEDPLYDAIMEVVTNPQYAKNMKRASEIFRDHQSTPLDTAIYWVEYVLKYKDTKHLQIHSINLQWYEYYLVDVVAFLGLIIISISFVLTAIILYLCKILSSRIGRFSKTVSSKKND